MPRINREKEMTRATHLIIVLFRYGEDWRNTYPMGTICQRCGHEYSMHQRGVYGPCQACNDCRAFVPKDLVENIEQCNDLLAEMEVCDESS